MENTDLKTECISLAKQCIEECRSAEMLSKRLPNMQHCADLCLRCADECEFLVSVCMKESISNPEYYDRCSSVCSECANECDKYEYMQFKRCAEICRKFQLSYIFQSYQTHQPIPYPYRKAV